MGLEVPLEAGETLHRHLIYRPKADGVPYAVAVSDRAVFTPAKRRGLMEADPWYLTRTPLSQIRRVRLVKAPPFGLYIVGGILIVGGLAAVAFMLSPVMAGEGGVVKAAPFFGVAYGAFLVYAAIGRRAIIIETTGKPIKLVPPTSLGIPDKAEISRIQEAFMEACVKVGLQAERAV